MNFKVKWWQLVFYETALISLGIIIGTLWNSFFANFLFFLLFIFAVCGGYVLYTFINQLEK